MSWIISLIIGGIIGWLASIVMKTNAQMGLIANVLIGIVGSMLGFWIAGLPQQGAMFGFPPSRPFAPTRWLCWRPWAAGRCRRRSAPRTARRDSGATRRGGQGGPYTSPSF